MRWKPRKKINLYYKAKDGRRYYIWTWPWGPYAEKLLDKVTFWYHQQQKKRVGDNIPKYAEKWFRKLADADGTDNEELWYSMGWGFTTGPYGIRFYSQEINQYIRDELQIDGYTKTIFCNNYDEEWVMFEKGA